MITTDTSYSPANIGDRPPQRWHVGDRVTVDPGVYPDRAGQVGEVTAAHWEDSPIDTAWFYVVTFPDGGSLAWLEACAARGTWTVGCEVCGMQLGEDPDL